MSINYKAVKPREVGGPMEMPAKSEKPRKVYPHIEIPLSALPEAEKWDPGKTYHVALELTMNELRVRKNGNKDMMDSWGNSAGFDVKGVAVLPNEGPTKKESPKKERHSRIY